jgi:outer membrane protein OmpA-like peptidoglycan-associated protein
MIKQLLTYSTALILLCSNVFAQSKAIQKATKHYESFSYSKVVETLLPIDIKTTSVNRMLGDSYKRLGNIDKAEECYSAVANAPDAAPQDAYNYFFILREQGKYTESENWMVKYYESPMADNRAKEYAKGFGSYKKLQIDEGRFKIQNLDMNTPDQDFGTAFYSNNEIVFASSRKGLKSTYRTWNGNNLNFLNLYKAKREATNELTDLKQFSKPINKKFHEGPAAFNGDYTFMVFTKDNYDGKSTDGVRKLQLFSSILKNGEWSTPEGFHFNNSEYSVGQASITADGKVVYFASDMPGGKGGTDIYKTTLTSNGVWSKPENLGEGINTEGNEMFPSIHKDGLLFFSSNGHIGLGGLDVFVAEEKDGKFDGVKNLGAPINDTRDDFGFILDNEQKNGYFSSNRIGGKGDDDIYSFTMEKPFNSCKQIKGIAKNKQGQPLADTKVNLYDSQKNVVESKTTTEDGAYVFCVKTDDNYTLEGQKTDYYDGKNRAKTFDKDEVIADVVLEKNDGFALYCIVTDATTKEPIKDVTITLINKQTMELETIVTPATGDFLRTLPTKKLNDEVAYRLKLEAPGYLTETFDYKKKLTQPGKYNIHEDLDVSMAKMQVGGDLAKMIDIKPIYFDVNKFNIRPDAAIELNKIIAVMTEYPTLEVELGSHTDCRAPIKYNETLSDKRAKASAAYIQAKIKNPNRIYGKGYGESKLKNGCACEGTVKSTCTDAEHQENRRTEFIITKM